eukprot:771909-Amphidinium_carterae.1
MQAHFAPLGICLLKQQLELVQVGTRKALNSRDSAKHTNFRRLPRRCSWSLKDCWWVLNGEGAMEAWFSLPPGSPGIPPELEHGVP